MVSRPLARGTRASMPTCLSFAWGKRISAGRWRKQLKTIWTLVAEGYSAAGALAPNAEGEVFVTGVHDNQIHKVGLDGKLSVFASDSQRCTSLAFGPDAQFIVSGSFDTTSLVWDTADLCKAASAETAMLTDDLGDQRQPKPGAALLA